MDILENFGPALLLSIIAGLSTGIGGMITYFIKRPKRVHLSFTLGFSAGVMIYISFTELLTKSIEEVGNLFAVIAFFIGILFIGIIDVSIPEKRDPYHRKFRHINSRFSTRNAVMRTGFFTVLAVAIHNFPEGIATFGIALSDLRLGIIVALAIALHNIPEGILVSIPIYYVTKNRRKSLIYAFLAGISEPVGAIVGFLILLTFLSEAVLFSMLAFAAGIMVYISIDEILPMAHRYGQSHTIILGVVLGMLIMAISLIII
jgi:ZIP family zinc transporter